jgi:large subunit ribosomal protein L9
MKVVLLKDVTGVGQKGTVQSVADGYALNRLIPQKLAVVATRESLSRLEDERKEKELAQAESERLWDEQERLLKDGKITIRAEASEKGHLYQQLLPAVIGERIKKELGVTVSTESISTKEPIRSLGRVEIHVRLGKRRVPLTVFVENKH